MQVTDNVLVRMEGTTTKKLLIFAKNQWELQLLRQLLPITFTRVPP